MSTPRDDVETRLVAELATQALCFLMEHPGVVSGSPSRRLYAECFRRFVLEMRARHRSMSLAAFSHAVQVPYSSLSAWLREVPDDSAGETPPGGVLEPPHVDSDVSPRPPPESRPMDALLCAFTGWRGSVAAFCKHVQRDLGIPWKRDLILRLLHEYGLRPIDRRRQRPRRSGSRCLHSSFCTFFPGAAWIADGTELTVHINGRAFCFNLELVVDADSGALVGASLRDHEDGQAVVDAFHDARMTTGETPVGLVLDRRSCNRSLRVGQLAENTALVFAGRERPQSKGHVEGAFGLFAQTAPDLVIHADDERELARQVLGIAVKCWARTLNYRPRRRRGGHSRVQLYRQAAASAEQRRQATDAIYRRAARGDGRRRRRRRDQTTALRPFIDYEFSRLGIADPDGHVRAALGEFSADTLFAGLGVYEGKQRAGTLPEDADGRYLLGIVKHIGKYDEGMHIADAHWRARETGCARLFAEWRARERTIVGRAPTVEDAVASLIDEALAERCAGARRFWLLAAVRAIRREVRHRARYLYLQAARRIHAALDMDYRDRLACVRVLADELIPLASPARA